MLTTETLSIDDCSNRSYVSVRENNSTCQKWLIGLLWFECRDVRQGNVPRSSCVQGHDTQRLCICRGAEPKYKKIKINQRHGIYIVLCAGFLNPIFFQVS